MCEDLSEHGDLDLPGIDTFVFDTSRHLVRESSRCPVIRSSRIDLDADFPAPLDDVGLLDLDEVVTDAIQVVHPLGVGLDGLATGTRPRTAQGVGSCDQVGDGARGLLVEAGRGLGGTSTWAGVNNYEPVAGATGLPEEVYHRLREIPNAVALQCRRESHRPEWFWGGFDCVPETDYHLSLSRRGGTPITFEPEILNQVMLDMVASSGATLLLQTRFKSLNRQNGHIQSIVVEGSSGNAVIQADIFIDSTAGIYFSPSRWLPDGYWPRIS